MLCTHSVPRIGYAHIRNLELSVTGNMVWYCMVRMVSYDTFLWCRECEHASLSFIIFRTVPSTYVDSDNRVTKLTLLESKLHDKSLDQWYCYYLL